jgi:hypothetical protein
MDLYGRPGGLKAAVLILLGILVVFFLWAWVARAERAGDTVTLYGTFRNSTGIAARPTTARAYVWKNGAIVDSSKTLVSGITNIRGHLYWTYTIPVSATNKSRYYFSMRAVDATITDWIECQPRSVYLSNAIVDSLSPAAVVDLYVGDSDSNFALIDATDGGGVYQNGVPVTGAFVFACSDQYLVNVIGVTTSTLGNYYLRFPVDPVAADTVYVSAWYQGSWVKTSTVVYP